MKQFTHLRGNIFYQIREQTWYQLAPNSKRAYRTVMLDYWKNGLIDESLYSLRDLLRARKVGRRAKV